MGQGNTMNPPEREPAWRYLVRILAAAVVSIGGVVLLLTLLVNARNWVVMGLLVGLLVPLVRVVADAVNPDVPNPATLAGYARRYLAVLLVLGVHLVALAALAPALLLALGVLGAVLGFIVALFGLLLWVLQHWAGAQTGRPLGADEWQPMLLLLVGAVAGGGACLGLLTGLMYLKDRLEPPFWTIVRTVQDRLIGSDKR
ncbi:MAG: hypothetical protein ACLFVO_23955 [Chloroflexaceae bacterium]